MKTFFQSQELSNITKFAFSLQEQGETIDVLALSVENYKEDNCFPSTKIISLKCSLQDKLVDICFNILELVYQANSNDTLTIKLCGTNSKTLEIVKKGDLNNLELELNSAIRALKICDIEFECNDKIFVTYKSPYKISIGKDNNFYNVNVFSQEVLVRSYIKFKSLYEAKSFVILLVNLGIK